MRAHALRALVWKETRQIGRNRMAMLTAAILPFFILVFVPMQLIASLALGGGRGLERLRDAPLPGFAVSGPAQLLVEIVLPIVLVLGGLLLPSLTTTYAVVAERERRSLELLVSLPVTVSEILAAKLLAVLAVTLLIGLPYVAIVLTLVLVLGIAGPAVVAALVTVFLAAVACSTAIALLLTLLARDFRTANNLTGLFIVPALLLPAGTLAAASGPARTYVLALVLLAVGGLALVVALRWVSFERYLE